MSGETETNASVADGFFPTSSVLDGLGVGYDPAAVLARLREAAAGGVTAFNSPEEECDSAARRRGGPATPAERDEFRRLFADREDMDPSNRLNAGHVVRVILRDHGGRWPVGGS